ncbi:MAG: hypothetical protein R2701_07790 [Acidimicrobiales bacterium]
MASPTDPSTIERPGAPSPAIRNVVIGVLVTMVIASYVGGALFPSLVNDHPLTLILLNASNRHLALASANLDPLAFYLGGFARLIAPDLFFFLLGRWYGDAAIVWMERKAPTYGELLRGLERWFDKARLVIVAIMPNNPVCLFAGAAGMSAGAFWDEHRGHDRAVARADPDVQLGVRRPAWTDPALHRPVPMVRSPACPSCSVLSILSDRRGGRDGIGDLLDLEEGMAEAEAELEGEATMDRADAAEAE